MRKRRNGEGWLDALTVLPWWLSIALAIASFLLMRWLATPDAIPPGAIRRPSQVFSGGLTRALATAGMFLLPILFLTSAVASTISRTKRDRYLASTRRDPTWEPDSRQPRSTDHPAPNDDYEDWKDAGKDSPPRSPIDTSRWSMELLRALEWKRFEYLCAGYFEELKFRAETVRAGPDGGVDIHLYAQGARHAGIIVQCKAWKTYKVGVKSVRELLGVMTADKVAEGVFVTTSTYTSEARHFAMGKNMHLIDGREFLANLLALPADRQQSLLDFITRGDYSTPTCASCGIKLVQRLSSSSGEPFWGCKNFPRCRTTMQVSHLQ